MVERPILFSGDMVRSILDGRKTVTRRPVSPQPVHVEGFEGEGPGLLQRWPSGRFYFAHDPHRHLTCPFGQGGDRLWVRETWATTEQTGVHPGDAQYVYQATDPTWGKEFVGWKWRPSIHMPRKACRLLLDVVSVRVEQIQEITEADAVLEGVGSPVTRDCKAPKFRELWDEIYGPQCLGWSANPYVWRIEFQKAVAS